MAIGAGGAIGRGGVDRKVTFSLGDYVVAAAVNGRLFAVGLGDGTVRLIDSETLDAEPISVSAHKGAVLCLTADIDRGAFLSGGDDGRLVRVAPVGTTETLVETKGRWVEHVAAHPGTGFRVYASGKDAFVLGKKSAAPRKLSHPTSAGGLAINPKGRRLAVSHNNGVSLW